MDMATANLDAAPTVAPLIMEYETEHLDDVVNIDLRRIPDNFRVKLLENAVKSFITNRVSTAAAKTKKDNAAWEQFEAAQAHDPLQTLVAEPTEPKATTDFNAIVARAVEALYLGQGGRLAGPKKSKALRDPLVTQITKAVVAEVYKKGRDADPSYKYPTAQKEVGQDGLEYLKAKIAEKVALGADEAALMKQLETRYIAPAKIMLGLTVPKSLADAEGIL